MLALPNNLNVIDKLQGRKGISQGLIWIENYNKILNSKNKHIGAGWYRPTFIDGLLTIKKTLIFLYKVHDKSQYNNLDSSSYFTLTPNIDVNLLNEIKLNKKDRDLSNDKLIEKIKKISNTYEIEKLNHQITKIELDKYKYSNILLDNTYFTDNIKQQQLTKSSIDI